MAFNQCSTDCCSVFRFMALLMLARAGAEREMHFWHVGYMGVERGGCMPAAMQPQQQLLPPKLLPHTRRHMTQHSIARGLEFTLPATAPALRLPPLSMNSASI